MPYLSPKLFHFIMTASFEKNEPGGRMLYQYCVDNHLDPFMLRLWITGSAHILMSSCEQEICINFERSEVKQLKSASVENSHIPTSLSLQGKI